MNHRTYRWERNIGKHKHKIGCRPARRSPHWGCSSPSQDDNGQSCNFTKSRNHRRKSNGCRQSYNNRGGW